MTTMSSPGSTGYATGGAPRALRRSEQDRIISGVCGGLGQYFAVDPVIFRVLFAVASIFGGVGLLAYGLAWLLIPDPAVQVSMLDRGLHQLRIRKVPPWVVVLGGAAVVWIGWFSWWAPSTLPAVLLLAVVVLVLLRRLRKRPDWSYGPPPPPPWLATAQAGPTTGMPAETAPTAGMPADTAPTAAMTPPWPASAAGAPEAATAPLLWPAAEPAADGNDARADLPVEQDRPQPTAALPGFDAPPPLIPPLSDTRRTMQAWLSEAGEAHRIRVLRRRPVKIAVGLGLLVGWGIVAMFDAFSRVPFPAYLWTGLAILGAGLLISLATRRMMLSLLLPMLVLAAVAVALGGTRASLSDGSGQIGWAPASLGTDTVYRQFAGNSTLDLHSLAPLTGPSSIRITQAAGAVTLQLPASLNATVIADVHLGDIRNGRSTATGQYQAGLNVHLQLDPPAAAAGPPLTIYVSLTDGHVQLDRTG